MTSHPGDGPHADDVPLADAAEQHQSVDPSVDEAGLNPADVSDRLERDANLDDVIDQAIIVPLPEDEGDVDSTDL